MVFARNFCEKRQRASEPHFAEVNHGLSNEPWLMAHWKVHGRLSIRVN